MGAVCAACACVCGSAGLCICVLGPHIPASLFYFYARYCYFCIVSSVSHCPSSSRARQLSTLWQPRCNSSGTSCSCFGDDHGWCICVCACVCVPCFLSKRAHNLKGGARMLLTEQAIQPTPTRDFKSTCVAMVTTPAV